MISSCIAQQKGTSTNGTYRLEKKSSDSSIQVATSYLIFFPLITKLYMPTETELIFLRLILLRMRNSHLKDLILSRILVGLTLSSPLMVIPLFKPINIMDSFGSAALKRIKFYRLLESILIRSTSSDSLRMESIS